MGDPRLLPAGEVAYLELVCDRGQALGAELVTHLVVREMWGDMGRCREM